MEYKKYQRKPTIIDAYQTDIEISIETITGRQKAIAGDYIIVGRNGEKYPCKKDVFTAHYEEVN